MTQRCLLASSGILLLGSIGAFVLFVPILSIVTVVTILVGLMLMFGIGVQVGRGADRTRLWQAHALNVSTESLASSSSLPEQSEESQIPDHPWSHDRISLQATNFSLANRVEDALVSKQFQRFEESQKSA